MEVEERRIRLEERHLDYCVLNVYETFYIVP